MLDLDTKYSRLEYRVEGTFLNPQIWTTYNDLVIQTGVIRRYLPGFTDRAWFTQVRLERDLFWNFRGFLGHGLEFARPFNIPEETLIITETQAGKLYRASMAMGGLRRDTTDNPIDPHRGGILSLTGEGAPDFLGSDLQFVRGVVDVRRYHSLFWKDFILAGRLKFGIIEPIQETEEIPVFRRFFAGGYNSVRGYRLDYLGPRNAAGNPIGGTSLLEGSLETRIPLYKEFRAVVFLDFGNVFLKPRDTTVGQLKYSSGFGLRYQTFFGPLGVDFGFPLNRIDPRRDPGYRIHFTIGQAF
jgi:outer membrane translocation and assembly module TamA